MDLSGKLMVNDFYATVGSKTKRITTIKEIVISADEGTLFHYMPAVEGKVLNLDLSCC